MPKSKKNKIVHLTQVKKKGKDHKSDLLKQLETYVREFDNVYIFDFDATKSDRILNLRLKMKQHGRIFAGRNSLASTIMKKSVRSKKFLKLITGHRGLLFTNLSSDKLAELLPEEFQDKLLGSAKLEAPKSKSKNSRDDDDDEDSEGADGEAES